MKKAILIGIEFPGNGSASLDADMEELKGLAETAQYHPIAIISQKLTAVNPKHLLAKVR